MAGPLLPADQQRGATHRTRRPHPVGGDNDTVHRATFRKSDFRQTSGASYRQVIDVSIEDPQEL